MKKSTKKLFGAAKISHDKRVLAERKAKAVIASIKSVKKRKAAMTAEELAAWRKKQSEASMKSYKARLAKMTPEQLAEFKAARNAKAKAKRLEKAVKIAQSTVEQSADLAVQQLLEEKQLYADAAKNA